MAKSTGTEHDYILVRMNKNGTLDTTFTDREGPQQFGRNDSSRLL